MEVFFSHEALSRADDDELASVGKAIADVDAEIKDLLHANSLTKGEDLSGLCIVAATFVSRRLKAAGFNAARLSGYLPCPFTPPA
jgi:hypothetical protein